MIKDEIELRIRDAVWHADFQVPSEEELAGEFGASRLTVRRALRELQDAGVLVRIQGRGTFVVGPRVPCAIFELRDISEEIEFSGGIHVSQVLRFERVPPDDPLAHLLPLPPGGTLFQSRLLHCEDGTPIQLEDRFVNAAEAPHYLEQDFTRITPHHYLLRATEVTSVDNSIRAVRADAESRRLLQIESDQPCLLLDRRTWRGSIPVTRSRFLYPGDRYRLRSAHEAVPTAQAANPRNINSSLGRIR
jgi:GntR family histidine utilization transcriptional repressor